MPLPAIHEPSSDVDHVLFPYEVDGCIVYDDPAFELIAEELCEGADEVVRYWMRKLKRQDIAFMIPAVPHEGWMTFEHRGTENGCQVYAGSIDDREQVMKLCPNFGYYYPDTPRLLHFTAVPVSAITDEHA